MYKIKFIRIHNGAEYYIEMNEDTIPKDVVMEDLLSEWKTIVDTIVKEDEAESISIRKPQK